MATYDYTFYMIQSIHEPSTYNYIGSSKNMPKRINKHKQDCSNETCKIKVYETMRLNGGWEAFEFVELEYHTMTEQDAREHEQRLIDQIQPTMNTNKAWTGLTRQEYCQQYRIDNKEQRNRYIKQYLIDNKEQRNQYIKQYLIDNKEQKQQYDKQYRIDNKERIHEKHTCDCGGKYTTQNKHHHLKSEKHQLWIADQHYNKQLFKRFKTAVKSNG